MVNSGGSLCNVIDNDSQDVGYLIRSQYQCDQQNNMKWNVHTTAETTSYSNVLRMQFCCRLLLFKTNSVHFSGFNNREVAEQPAPYLHSLYATNILSCWVRDVALGFVNKCEHKGKGGWCKNPALTYISDLYMFHISHNYSSSLEAVQILTGCRLSHQHSWGEAGRNRRRRDFEHQTINLV